MSIKRITISTPSRWPRKARHLCTEDYETWYKLQHGLGQLLCSAFTSNHQTLEVRLDVVKTQSGES